MPRAFLFEFEDLPWFPQVIREGMMDYLRHMIEWTHFYEPCARVIADCLTQTKSNKITELCAGGGGGVLTMIDHLAALNCRPQITLTDLYPNHSRWEALRNKSTQIDFAAEPVNALYVSPEVKGLRIMFSAIHHFRPAQVKSMLTDAVTHREPIAIFDAGTTSPLAIPAVILLEPITFVLLTPFFRPFRWSRLFFTYVIPLIILCTIWDGCVSILRFYTKRELEQTVHELQHNKYIWKVGTLKNRLGIPIHFVTGIPADAN